MGVDYYSARAEAAISITHLPENFQSFLRPLLLCIVKPRRLHQAEQVLFRELQEPESFLSQASGGIEFAEPPGHPESFI